MNELEHGSQNSDEPYGSVNGKDVVSGLPVFPMEPHTPRRADIEPKIAQRVERHGLLPGVARGEQALGHRAVPLGAGELVDHLAVPIEAEPL